MQIARHYRYTTNPHGTLGKLLLPGFGLWILEPHWRNNIQDISCIPAGVYDVVPRQSEKYGKHYHIMNVPDRTYILQHSGNLAGDRDKNLITHTWGCQLPGDRYGQMDNQLAVFNSRLSMNRLITFLQWRPYRLVIINRF